MLCYVYILYTFTILFSDIHGSLQRKPRDILYTSIFLSTTSGRQLFDCRLKQRPKYNHLAEFYAYQIIEQNFIHADEEISRSYRLPFLYSLRRLDNEGIRLNLIFPLKRATYNL